MFLFDAVKAFNIVAGSWFLFTKEEDTKVMIGLMDRVEVGPSFIESNAIIVGVLAVVVVVTGVIIFAGKCI